MFGQVPGNDFASLQKDSDISFEIAKSCLLVRLLDKIVDGLLEVFENESEWRKSCFRRKIQVLDCLAFHGFELP